MVTSTKNTSAVLHQFQDYAKFRKKGSGLVFNLLLRIKKDYI